jgi:hypothetical protein
MRKDDQFVRAPRRLCDDPFAEKLRRIAGGLLRQDRFAKDLRALQLGLQAHAGRQISRPQGTGPECSKCPPWPK